MRPLHCISPINVYHIMFISRIRNNRYFNARDRLIELEKEVERLEDVEFKLESTRSSRLTFIDKLLFTQIKINTNK